jgi:hypothetical protein
MVAAVLMMQSRLGLKNPAMVEGDSTSLREDSSSSTAAAAKHRTRGV